MENAEAGPPPSGEERPPAPPPSLTPPPPQGHGGQQSPPGHPPPPPQGWQQPAPGYPLPPQPQGWQQPAPGYPLPPQPQSWQQPAPGYPPPPPGWQQPAPGYPPPPGWQQPPAGYPPPQGWQPPPPGDPPAQGWQQPPAWSQGWQQPPPGYPQPPQAQGWWAPPQAAWRVAGPIPGWDRAGTAVAGSGRYRTMGVPELIDGAFALYRRTFWPIVVLAALVAVPEAALTWIVSHIGDISGHTSDVQSISNAVSSQGYATPEQHDALLNDLGALIGSFAALIGVAVVARQLSVAALSPVVSDRYLGRPASLGGALRVMGRRFLPLLGGELLLVATVVVCFGAGPLLGVLAGSVPLMVILLLLGFATIVTVWFRWLLMPQVVVLEGVGPIAGLRRSWRLTKGRYWRTVGIWLLLQIVVSLAAFVVSSLLTLPFSGAGTDTRLALQAAAGALSGILVAPVGIIGLVLYYYDLRIRGEGFDLEMLARSL